MEKLRIIVIILTVVIWLVNGFYSVYLNALRIEQYRKLRELRHLKEENFRLYYKITKILNFKKGLKFALAKNYTPVKPYHVINFYPYFKNKKLYDFYIVWFGDTLSSIAKKFNLSIEELIQANPQLEKRRFIYPTMILKIPVKNYNLPQCQSGFSFLKNRNQRRTKSRKEEIPANIGNNNKRKNSNF